MGENSLGISIAKIASTSDYIPPKILRFMLQAAARELLPDERVAKCLRQVLPTSRRIEVYKSRARKTAHYRGLLVCSRIWHCPVCAATISEERRKELSKATNSWGGDLALLTFTFSHARGTALQVTLDKLLGSHRDFKSGRVFSEMQEYFGWHGSVKSLEVTYGVNGWHPHIHELVFLTNKMSEDLTELFQNNVYGRWRTCLKKVNAFASVDRGVTVKMGNAYVSEYVAKFGGETADKKWTFAHEMTKQVVKRGKIEGRTPTQLLYDYMMGDKQSGKLWQEYALILKGRHQLVWSRGLRETLKLGDEASDEQIADSIPEDSVLLAELTRGQWYDVLSNNAVGSILHAAETKNEEEFKDWLTDNLRQWSQV